MENIKLMPDPLDMREITFTNLLLLGFDVDASEEQYRIPFNRDMFSVPNRKAMEVVIHFLFLTLNKSNAKERFRNCWPVHDRKREQEFRKVSSEWLTKIKRDSPDSNLPNIVPSLLVTPTGDKFYQFLFYFSSYVLKVKASDMKKKYGLFPGRPIITTANRKFLSQICRSQQIQTIQHQAVLATFVQNTSAVKQEWMEYAKTLSKEHRKLHKKRRDLEKSRRKLDELAEQVYKTSKLSSKETLKRTQNLQKTNEFWKAISNLYEVQKGLAMEMEKVLQGENSQCVLDGEEMYFKIPDILLRKCEEQLKKGTRVRNVYEDGKVNLNSLLQLWNLSLHMIKDTLIEFPLPSVDQDELYIRAEAHNHTNYLNRLTSLGNALNNELIPELEMSTEELKKTIRNEGRTRTPLPMNMKNFGLEYLPETPTLSFNFQSKSQPKSLPEKFSKKQEIDTPDAVNHLLKNIHRTYKEDENTPIRNIQGKPKIIKPSNLVKEETPRIYSSNMKSNKMKTNVPKKPESMSKIPLPRNSQQALRNPQQAKKVITNSSNETNKLKEKKKVVLQPHRDFESKTSIDGKSMHNNLTSRHAGKKVISNQNKSRTENKKGVHNESFDVSKAQELLIDQITQSVLKEESLLSSGGSVEDDRDSGNLHALQNPLEAFNMDAFVTKDKVPRTPAVKKHANPFEHAFGEILSKKQSDSPEELPRVSPKENDIDDIRNRLNQLSTAEKDVTNKQDYSVELLQERINRLRMKDVGDNHSEHINEVATPDVKDNQKYINTLINKNNTVQVENIHELLTPLHTPINYKNDNYSFITPLKDVAVTPLNDTKTPVNNTNTDTETPLFKTMGDTFNTREKQTTLIDFCDTPLKTHDLLQQKLESNKKHDLDSSNKLKENMDLFWENNQLLNTTLVSSNTNTPITPKQNQEIINFITPFKDPFSPNNSLSIDQSVNRNRSIADQLNSSNRQTNQSEDNQLNNRELLYTPISKFDTSSNSFEFSPLKSIDRSLHQNNHSRLDISRFDVTIDEIDSFIEEISNKV